MNLFRKQSTMNFRKATHVIFDLDGLLIASESIYDKILHEIAGKFDRKYTNGVRLKLMGITEQDTAKIAVRELDLPLTTEEFLKIYKRRVNDLCTHPNLMPGAKKLIKHFYETNIPIAVGTSSSQDEMELKTKCHEDLFKLFNHIVCGSTDPAVKHGKPSPDIFLVTASRFPDKPNPSQCLVFEDSPSGTVAARRAGMQAIMVPEEHVNNELRKPATLVLKSLEEFQPELFGLPPFRCEKISEFM